MNPEAWTTEMGTKIEISLIRNTSSVNNNLDLESIKIYCLVYMLSWRTLAGICEQTIVSFNVLSYRNCQINYSFDYDLFCFCLYTFIYHVHIFYIINQLCTILNSRWLMSLKWSSKLKQEQAIFTWSVRIPRPEIFLDSN